MMKITPKQMPTFLFYSYVSLGNSNAIANPKWMKAINTVNHRATHFHI